MPSSNILIGHLLNRMYNWKCRSAAELAKTIPEVTPKSLKLLNDLAYRFDDCGWQSGKAFDDVRTVNNRVAKQLGYEWSDEKDYWVKAHDQSNR